MASSHTALWLAGSSAIPCRPEAPATGSFLSQSEPASGDPTRLASAGCCVTCANTVLGSVSGRWWLGESDQQSKAQVVFSQLFAIRASRHQTTRLECRVSCERFIAFLLSKDERRRGIFHSSCRHAPAPDRQQWILGGTQTAGSTTEEVDFVAKWGPRGGISRDPGRERGASLPETSTRAENFRRTPTPGQSSVCLSDPQAPGASQGALNGTVIVF